MRVNNEDDDNDEDDNDGDSNDDLPIPILILYKMCPFTNFGCYNTRFFFLIVSLIRFLNQVFIFAFVNFCIQRKLRKIIRQCETLIYQQAI